MPLGDASLSKLLSCHPDLQLVIKSAAKAIDAGALAYAGIDDIAVLCGYRGREEQNKAVKDKTSKTPWPLSKHNRTPSDAVDVAVYPVNYDDLGYEEKMKVLHAFICGIAAASGIELFNIDWDMPHIQRNVP